MRRTPIGPTVVYINTMQESRLKTEARLAQQEYKAPDLHPYDQARETMPPLAFADHVLKAEGMIHRMAGADFVDGKYGTPLVKIRVANRVLKRLCLRQIDGDPSWLV